jgi:hypothetical protein
VHDGLDVLARGPVDRRVVEFHEDGERAVWQAGDTFESLDDVRHPQRPRVIELPGLQPCDLRHEFVPAARLRQRDVADVILQVEVAIFGPVRVVERKRHLHQLLPEQVHAVETLLERREDFLEAHRPRR